VVWGCAFEDFLSRDLDDGRNIVEEAGPAQRISRL
jgi:hypothetical protein